MIEFTYSRVTLCICGIALLASVGIPLTGMYSSNEDVLMSENADRIAWMLDSLHGYDADEFTIRGWDVLPGSDCGLIAEGHEVILKNSKGEYVSHTLNVSRLTLGYNEEIRLKVVDGVLVRL
ncbi:MAG: hypothetical protein ACOX1N_05165 [Candidatus Methanomethylophilaceae archaeon]